MENKIYRDRCPICERVVFVNAVSSYSKRNCIDAVRQFCLNCCQGISQDVEDCELQECPLWGFRMGAVKVTKKSVEQWKARMEKKEKAENKKG